MQNRTKIQPQDILDIQRKRLIQLVWITEIALFSLAFKAIVAGSLQDGIVMFLAAITILSVPMLIQLNRQKSAATLFACLLTLMILLIMWTSNGIKDNAILALPGILVFTAMTGAKRIFTMLWLFMGLNVLLMGWLSDLELFSPIPAGHSLFSAIDLAVILGICGVATSVLARDNLTLMRTLGEQVKNVEVSKQEMEYMANHDHLTGLPNRHSAEQHFHVLKSNLGRHPNNIAAILFVDLDEFKDINDALGHDMGDRFLAKMSSRIKDVLRTSDRVFRIGGDEFLVFIEDFGNAENIVYVAEKLKTAFAQPIYIRESRLQCSASIGIVVIPRDADDYQNAVKRADIAMYRAKEQGKNCYHFYDDSMEHSLLEKYQLQQDLKQSIQDEHFYVLFQPIVDLHTEQYIGAEALIRWQHPVRGTISPMSFIPIAEKSGYIDELCRFVLKKSTELLDRINLNHPEFYISVNLSPLQLKETGLRTRILSGIPQKTKNNIKLEMTESQIIENIETYAQNVRDIQEAGVGMFLDDFGTGYSNLGYLQRLRFETLKIDRSFCSGIHQNKEKQPLVNAVAKLSADMNMKVIAEGIESREELAVLRELNVPFGQGYLWSMPIKANALLELL